MYHSGYGKNHLTEICPPQLVDFKQMHTNMILKDLLIALNHGVHLEKIKDFGFQISVTEWCGISLTENIFFG